MSNTHRCAHPGCTCNASKDRKDGFCSEYCKAHGADPNHTAHGCECKHGACAK